MNSFLKIIVRNVLKGPSTIKYPFEDSPAPEKLRGKIKHDPDKCIACGMCEYVCAGGAIKLQETKDKQGISFTVWHNSCAFCGLCAHYCPENAIQLTNDYHTAHAQEDKYNYTEKTIVKKQRCSVCGEPFMPLAAKYMEKVYGKGGDEKGRSRMCPKCRRRATWKDGVFKP